MNSHAHVILELPAAKEVSILWDLKLSVSSRSQDDREREREREKERERRRFEDVNTLPCRVRVVFNHF